MSILKLRTLTEKSKLGFGKYAQNTVAEIIHKGNRQYLFWVYYNSSNITFTDEILDKINLFRNRIPKPGKAPELYEGKPIPSKNSLRQLKQNSHFKKEVKTAKRMVQKGRENTWFRKSSLAWKNQGH